MTDSFDSLDATDKHTRPAELRLPGIDVALSFDAACHRALATPNDVALADCTPGTEVPHGHLLESALPPPVPDAPAIFGPFDLETPSPSAEHQHNPLPTSLAGTLPSVAPQTSGAASLITRHGLRLPSFETLGIAAPHSGRKLTTPNDGLFVGGGPLSMPGDPLHELSLGAGPTAVVKERSSYIEGPLLPSTDASQGSMIHYVPTLTPPDETERSRWPGQFPSVTSAAMQSPAQSDPERTTPNADLAGDGEGPEVPPHMIPATAPAVSSKEGMEGSWIDPALHALLSGVIFDRPSGHALRVLSHALPSPSANGHIFPQVINRILDRMAPRPTTWINVFHAVPGTFNLSELPTSPPNTPGTVVGGDDYFTSKTFDTAVPVSDYEGPATALPKSPRPVVPPGSIDVSIVERYLPPTTPNETTSLFDRSTCSLLGDRLVELSTSSGLLLFIYPTKAGAATFMSEYLGPVLEPLVRSMTIINDLPTELGSVIHQMAAVDHLAEFAELHASMDDFCRQLSTSNDTLSRFHPDRKAVYEIVYASPQEVNPPRDVWSADWWVKQEKPRIRQTIAKFMRESKKQQDDIMPTSLVQEILDGVASKSQPGRKPAKGIEVGVFVIRKSI